MAFQPVLRFAALSDIHLKDTPTVERTRLAQAIDTAVALCTGDAAFHPVLDAFCVVGDFANRGTETQFQAMKDILDAHLPAETKLILTCAGHDYRFSIEGIQPVRTRVAEIFGIPHNIHTVINGYHFIAMSTGRSNTARFDGFDEEKRAFYRHAIAEAEADHPTRPIFAFQHPHPEKTCYGSEKWGTEDLLDIQKEHPRLVIFSGHSHAPINDPRSIDQQDFTSIGTGSLSYFELDEFDKVYGTVPPGAHLAAQFHLVEADAAGCVRITPYDLITNRPFCEPILLGPVWDREHFVCTPNRPGVEAVPYFQATDRLTVVSAGSSAVTFHFPQAQTDAFRVNAYYASIRTADGTEVKRESVWSGYYFNDMPPMMHWRIEGLQPGTTYTLTVEAESFWHRHSAPLETTFTTAL